jgi:mono/diheme cytochrome c family protein
MPGCRGDRSDSPPRQFFPDMDDQPKIKPQTESQFYPDGRGTRPVVEGTVAWGASVHDPSVVAEVEWAGFVRNDRERRLGADRTYSFGLVSGSNAETPMYIDVMPIEVSRDLILEGQQQFDIFCAACHGYTGTGDGTVGVLWSYPPSNLLGEIYRDPSTNQGKDGYLFHVIREGVWAEGVNRMPAYKHAVDEQEAWAIVAYLRTLQESQAVPLDALNPTDRERLLVEGVQP